MKDFYEELLNWYYQNRRELPWREDPAPYHVWLSEIMLQQTRVEAAREYYLRFLNRLPDVSSLAEASEDTCLKLWEGLGYYSRVRNMKRAATEVMEKFGGHHSKYFSGIDSDSRGSDRIHQLQLPLLHSEREYRQWTGIF